MNDATPRRYTGTLLERAASIYQLAPGALPPLAFEDEQPFAATYDDARALDSAAPSPAAPAEAPAAAAPTRVAAVDRRRVSIDREALAAAGMIVPGASVTALAEEFRLVKRQLLLTSRSVAAVDPDKARMMLVCSANPDDGKTFCAINLAMSLAAETDAEILLVDADFAKPDVLQTLGVEAGAGLLDALADPGIDAESLIIDTDVPQLAILPAGTRSNTDTEMLASERARAVLRGLVEANPRRIMVFDSPPALAASPASELAALVGQVMLVVRADRTSEADLRAAVGLLDGCEHVQLVLNAVSYRPGGRRFGTYYDQEPVK